MDRFGHGAVLSGVLATLNGTTVGKDVTPATISWGAIVAVGFGRSITATLSGINAPITLQISGSGGGFYYSKNAATLTKIADLGTVTVSNGDTLSFASDLGSGTATVTNLSDSSTVIATILYDVFTSPF